MYALLFQLPYLLKLLYQWGPEQSGHFMTAFMVSMMAASDSAGGLAEAIGVRTTCMAGSLISVAGLYWLSILTPAKDDAHRRRPGARRRRAWPRQRSRHNLPPWERSTVAMSGIASGVISTCRYLGGVVGISVLGLLLSAPASAQSLDQYRQAILVFAGSFLIAATVSLLFPGRPKRV